MLIRSLCDYYDIQSARGEAASDIMSEQPVHWMVMLTPDGRVADIIDKRIEESVPQKNGKVKIVKKPIVVSLPKRTQKTGIDANIIEHRPLYIFGLNYDAKIGLTPDDKTGKARKSHEAFVKKNLEFFDGIDSEIARAYVNFIKNWVPENETENEQLKKLGKEYQGSYYIFALDGSPECKLHKDKAVLAKYEEIMAKAAAEAAESDDGIMMCPIEGERLRAARIHDKIKGIKGGNSVGAVLVNFNSSAFESYGKSQSMNSGISEKAMKKYTSSLNKLLADPMHHIYSDDMTVVFFAMKHDDKAECDLFSDYLNSSNAVTEDSTKADVKAVSENIYHKGQTGNAQALDDDVDNGVDFFVAGFTPNGSRICQKFMVRNKFGKIIDNVKQHQQDMAICGSNGEIPLWRINKELVSPNSANAISPALQSDIFQAILNGTNYPYTLLETVVRRVCTDSDTDSNNKIKINEVRAGLIKAFINRKARLNGDKEEITMSLDKENKNPAYLCGRLFAVLEKIQLEATDVKLNRTIKDAYFSSASSRPALIMPRLIDLSNYHLRKLKEGRAIDFSKLINEIMGKIKDSLPTNLSIMEKGKFQLGYFQQNKDFFAEQNKNEEPETVNE
ncbi:type I-C CRISPR-associated protein Cas8c/Csd1 [Huintestinicola sp.]|jgi:CRISPR-associated protein, csd1 family|uniref:type I-C CRISPR-associated protein Cas8c/Csd1 n=1 Tax=Huintestinicola sp. TaxID=2981661 RepID=UPI0011C8DCB3